MNVFCKDLQQAVFTAYAVEPPDNLDLLVQLPLSDNAVIKQQDNRRIKLAFKGELLKPGSPRHFTIVGEQLTLQGTCSIFPNVCSTDILLNKAYFQTAGQQVWVNITLDLKKILR